MQINNNEWKYTENIKTDQTKPNQYNFTQRIFHIMASSVFLKIPSVLTFQISEQRTIAVLTEALSNVNFLPGRIKASLLNFTQPNSRI